MACAKLTNGKGPTAVLCSRRVGFPPSAQKQQGRGLFTYPAIASLPKEVWSTGSEVRPKHTWCATAPTSQGAVCSDKDQGSAVSNAILQVALSHPGARCTVNAALLSPPCLCATTYAMNRFFFLCCVNVVPLYKCMLK